jgi:hypothetical protein
VSADGQGGRHMPAGPDWGCDDCVPRAAWPCSPARAGLRTEYKDDRIGLHMYLAAAFLKACQDMPTVPAGPLFVRFMGWAR